MPFSAVRVEGGIIAGDVLEMIARGEAPGQRPQDFGLADGRRLHDEMAAVWSDALHHWAAFQGRRQRRKPTDSTTSITREHWTEPLFDLLGYQLFYRAKGTQVQGRTYLISHRAGDDNAPPVHVVGFDVDLDHRGSQRMAPFSLLQDYLNHSEDLWGIVTNGLRFRILRTSNTSSRPSYIDFDLEQIFEGNKFSEFMLFYRLAHRSRLPQTKDKAPDCLLEKYYNLSIDQGHRVRDRLREGVEEALKIFGTGFLRHPGNESLRRRWRRGELSAVGYYQQLLRLVYRLLFLAVAEERGMVFPEESDPEKKKLLEKRRRVYQEYYSLSRLRPLVERPISPSYYDDLWLGIRKLFWLFSQEAEGNALGVPPLNGDLFGPQALPDLETADLYNHELLKALRGLFLFRENSVWRRVSYAALDVEEFGSVYESLLDYHPEISEDSDGLVFDLVTGSERKSTGSYYTRRDLVQALIKSTLDPVIEERLAPASTLQEKEKALLDLKVIDPAAGSGHFLLAAARRIGRELARVRTGDEEPSAEAFRRAVRDVIQHCIYGVDLNPLAVDLCKVALWVEGHNPGRPLSFLDHRIRCGNSLIGAFDMRSVEKGIPDGAFKPLFGDNKEIAAGLKKQNRKLDDGAMLFSYWAGSVKEAEVWRALEELDQLPEEKAADVQAKARRYAEIRQTTAWRRRLSAANLWTAAFFTPLKEETKRVVPNFVDLYALLYDTSGSLPPDTVTRMEKANALAEELHFFHWELEFPTVFENGGFDVVLGNPPWDTVEFKEEEFFALREPDISDALNKAERQLLIEALAEKNPELYREFVRKKYLAEAGSKFLRASGRFPLAAVGKLNTYALFAELAARHLVRRDRRGRAGLIVPTGIATDDSNKAFFGNLLEDGRLISLYDFENREGLFPAVDSRYKFSLLTIGPSEQKGISFVFFATRVDHLQDEERVFTLEPGDLKLFNPNTKTCPVFRTRKDAELAKKIYDRVPVFVNEATGENLWGVSFKQMFNMATASHLFLNKSEAGLLPLYEAKLFHQFDHRWATYIDEKNVRDCTPEEKADPGFAVRPRYWVYREAVEERLEKKWPYQWLLAFRDITNATNERTVIVSFLPRTAVGHKGPLIMSPEPPELMAALATNLNSIVLDWVARQKVGGTSLSYFYLKQLPVLPPLYYELDLEFIRPRVLELSYTAWDMAPLAIDLGYDGPPFAWDEERRALLRAELDAYFAYAYGLTRNELRYILDPKDVYGDDFPGESFRVLKAKEEAAFGEYRTRRLILEAYDRLLPEFKKMEASKKSILGFAVGR